MVQRYGGFLPIPRKIPNSSLTCSDVATTVLTGDKPGKCPQNLSCDQRNRPHKHKIKIGYKCLMNKKKVVSLQNGFIR